MKSYSLFNFQLLGHHAGSQAIFPSGGQNYDMHDVVKSKQVKAKVSLCLHGNGQQNSSECGLSTKLLGSATVSLTCCNRSGAVVMTAYSRLSRYSFCCLVSNTWSFSA